MPEPIADLPTPPSPAGRRGPVRRAGRWLGGRPAALWSRVRPAPRTRRWISIASVAFVMIVGGVLGSRLRSGYGTLADIGIGTGSALVATLIFAMALPLLRGLTRLGAQTVGSLGFAAFLGLTVLLDNIGLSGREAAIVAGVGVGLTALLFGSLAVLTSNRQARGGFFKKTWVGLCAVAAIAGMTATGLWLFDRGSTEHLLAVTVPAPADATPLDAENPAQPGPHGVRTLTYGSGDDRRPEFGADATLKTTAVNAKPFAKQPSGWRGRLRQRFWGFDTGALPLNARVWYPDGDGPFPLVLCVHGNHSMAEYSDPGYAWLGELLASRGYIFGSVDENFLNGGGFLHGSVASENDARAWILLEHLRVWHQWNQSGDTPFTGKVDTDRIALIGHSRGGEAVGHAALFNRLQRYPDDASVALDFGYSIRGVLAIAPCDGQYRPGGRLVELRDVSYFTIQGGHDADVSSFVGDRTFRRLRFSRDSDAFKASLFVHRANHGQFNTVWGDTDLSSPRALVINRAALLTGEEQRQIGAVFISAFLEAVLRDNAAYRDLFRNHARGGAWLPETPMVSRYEDASFELVADFEEDVDVTTTSIDGGRTEGAGLAVWREGDIPLRGKSRRDDNGVYLGWDSTADPSEDVIETSRAVDASAARSADEPARYEIRLPPDFAATLALRAESTLVLSLAAVDEKPEPKDYSPTEASNDNGNDAQPSEANDSDDGKPAGDAPTEDDEADDDDRENDDEKSDDEKSDDEPAQVLDLTLELVDAAGTVARVPLSQVGALLPPLKSRFLRPDLSEQSYSATEPCLQSFRLPLALFASAEPKLEPAALRTIRLVFDRSEKGVVVLDRVGFER